MTHLEEELNQLKVEVIDMINLTTSQLEKAKEAFIKFDSELAEEVIHIEKRVNAMEISIDRTCESLIALYQPLATDFRFVISMLKINSDLERIGDLACGVASYVLDMKRSIPKDSISKTEIEEMFDVSIQMMNDVLTAYENEDTKLARKVYKQDRKINKINIEASTQIENLIKADTEHTSDYLFLFSSIRKLERIGDHIKNVTEDIIFHIDAKRMKHKKKMN
ncbi:MAG: phosphate signaling complex protein PhoU [Cyclobacteriaceae bacterium]